MATIKEIAERAGVSIGTVDRVLHNRGMVSEKTREKIMKIVRELNYQPNQTAQGLAVMKKKLKLGFFTIEGVKHPYFIDVVCAAEQKAKELEQYGVQVTVIEADLYSNDQEGEIQRLVHLAEGMDGVVTIGIKDTILEMFAEIVIKAGKPVVYYNRYLKENDFLAYVGCDYMQAGRLAAGMCAITGGEDAKVCIYSESYESNGKKAISTILPSELPEQDRMEGFEKEMKERYPKMKILERRTVTDNQIDNYLSAVEMFRQYPDVDIVYVVNPGDYGICEAIYRADQKRQVRIITNDLTGKVKDMMKKGMISATICQEPKKQGAQSLEILFQYLAYGTKPDSKMCYTDLSIHIAQNI
ncbi:MAG TPA: LacI family transcriptional regulator [Candidatus Mediterraneibacter cottocaccae]|nr:LacI family transcriptional regulator [Candidatus Mediterraneibacter cottocaccae]